ncbi:MAG: TolB family protein, partial [Aggregatilineales bacterium]
NTTYPVTFVVNQEAGHPGTGTVKATVENCQTSTKTPTPTNTPITPTKTNTPTNTPITPTATNTPTNTPITPTATNTPTNTPITPTATNTPTNTSTPTIALTGSGTCSTIGTATFTLTNNGATSLPSGTTYTVTNASNQVVLSGSLTLAAGQSTTITVPNMNGALTLTVSNGTQVYATLNTTCTPTPPAITGNGTCSSNTAVFTLTNSGGQPLPSGTTYTITNSSNTVVSSGPLTLAVGQSQTISVPNMTGTLTLTVSNGTTVYATLNAQCGQPPVKVTGAGSCTNNTGTFTVTNSGTTALPSGTTYTVTDSTGKTVASGALTLAAGKSQTITVPNMTGTLTLAVSNGTVIYATLNTTCTTPPLVVPTRTPVPTVTPSKPQRPTWTGLKIGPTNTCPDWLVYHTDQASVQNSKGTGQEIFRLGDLPNQKGTPTDLSQTPNKMLPDGITPVQNIGPSQSPDRAYIAFASNRDGSWQLYTAPTSGIGSVLQMTFNGFDGNLNVAPVWSPDGQYVAYESAQGGNWNLYVFAVTRNGAVPEQVTNTPATDIEPYWSPNSKQLVFESNRSGTSQLYTYDLATKKTTQITTDNADHFNPTFSPDGKHLAYRTYTPDNPNVSVLTIADANGKNAKAISDVKGTATNQSWAPGAASDLIAYQSDMHGQYDVFVYQLSTGKTRLVTDNADKIAHYAPTWYCNSTTLVFTSDVTGNANIFSTAALPIDAKPINVATDATRLTDIRKFQDHFAQNFPQQAEEASRLNFLPVPTTK